jgi:hypothetical protein
MKTHIGTLPEFTCVSLHGLGTDTVEEKVMNATMHRKGGGWGGLSRH